MPEAAGVTTKGLSARSERPDFVLDEGPGLPPVREHDRFEKVAAALPEPNYGDSEDEASDLHPFAEYRDRRANEARKRNTVRIDAANKADAELVGKYLPASVSEFFPCRLLGPSDDYVPSPEWVRHLVELTKMPVVEYWIVRYTW